MAALSGVASSDPASAADLTRPAPSDGDYPTAPNITSPAPGAVLFTSYGGCVPVDFTPSTDTSGVAGYLVDIDADPAQTHPDRRDVDDPASHLCAATWLRGADEGTHSLQLRAVDLEGNFSDLVVVPFYAATKEPLWPTDFHVSSAAGIWAAAVSWRPGVLLDPDEYSPPVEYRIYVDSAETPALVVPADDSAHYAVSVPITAGLSTDAASPAHRVRLQTVDAHGRTSSWDPWATVHVDGTAPEPPIILGPPGVTWTRCEPVEVPFHEAVDAEEAITGYAVRYSDGGGELTTGDGNGPGDAVDRSLTVSFRGAPTAGCNATDGIHPVEVVAHHPLFGDVPSGSMRIGVDTAAPSVGPAAGTDRTLFAGPNVFRWARASDTLSGVARVQLLIDGNVVATMSGSATSRTLTLGPGRHVVTVRAEDRAGNSSAARTAVSVVARVAPTRPRIVHPLAGAAHRRLLLSWIPSQPSWGAVIRSYEVRLDGRTVARLPSGARSYWVRVPPGRHSLVVRVQDSRGRTADSTSRPVDIS